ncbi:MAG TPA: tetratricopeptide repeat protein [Verrucomicrobiae bacterium]|nr:tetratricopeptide repeat protein [Verrucomicrobiae bacterium]
MEIVLGSPARRAAPVLLSLATAAILIFQASVLWRADHLLESQKVDLMERAAALTPGNGDVWDKIGRLRQWDFTNPNLREAISDYQRAVKEDPRTAHYWMDLASAYESGGDDAGAQDAFAHAKAVYPASGEVAFHYGNFLLRQERYTEAFAELRQAVRADPTLLPLAISRTWRSTEDVQQLLDQVLPANVDAYEQAVDFFASSGRAEPALVVWQRLVALRQPVALPRAFPFLDELIREDRAEDARRVWREALAAAGLPHDEPANHSAIWNGSFAKDFLNGGLDWRWSEILGAAVDFDAAPPGGGARAVRLDFTGGSNLALTQPSEYVPVEPARGYHFHALMRTEGITTESGLRFSITDANHADQAGVLTDNLIGSHAWTPVDTDLTTGAQTHFLLVRLLRNPSRLFENKLSGTAWIADVSLLPAEHASQ